MAEPAAHSQVPAGHPAFPPFQAEHFPSQLAWLAVSFVLLYVLMAKVALPRIAAIFAERSKRIGDDLKAAQGFKEQSDAAHAAYEKALADARARAQALLADSRQRQTAEVEAGRKALDATLNARIAEAEIRIAQTKSAAMVNVRGIATEAAAAIVERLIGIAPASPDVVAAAVAESLDR